MSRLVLIAALVSLSSGLGALAQETPVGILADHIRTQGFSCKTPESASRDEALSKADEQVWTLKCDGISYRVRLVPDQAAKVEKIQG
jgi:hypothetical protein